jgi:hypothetical protein
MRGAVGAIASDIEGQTRCEAGTQSLRSSGHEDSGVAESIAQSDPFVCSDLPRRVASHDASIARDYSNTSFRASSARERRGRA